MPSRMAMRSQGLQNDGARERIRLSLEKNVNSSRKKLLRWHQELQGIWETNLALMQERKRISGFRRPGVRVRSSLRRGGAQDGGD